MGAYFQSLVSRAEDGELGEFHFEVLYVYPLPSRPVALHVISAEAWVEGVAGIFACQRFIGRHIVGTEVMVENDLLGDMESPVGEVIDLERGERALGYEVAGIVVALDVGQQVEQCRHILHLAVDHSLGVGQRHGNLQSECTKLVVLPSYEASVFCLWVQRVGRSLEHEFEVAVGVLDGEIAQEREHTILREDAVGLDAEPWCSEDEHCLVVEDIAVGQHYLTYEVHHCRCGRECHVGYLHVEIIGEELLYFLRHLQGEIEVEIAVGPT